ncbi:MAG: histidine kinase [Steroidobacter sp.]
MNLAPRQQYLPVDHPTVRATDANQATTGALSRRKTLLAILTCFWVYVTISNVLYANSMQINIATFSDKQVFAPWSTRVLQHLFVYPLFIASVWVSFRIGWKRLWRTLPLQLLLAGCFSALPFFAMTVAEHLQGEHSSPHPYSAGMWLWPHPDDMAIWLASATNFLLTYGFGVALATGFNMYQRFRDSELRLTTMERAWSSARLSALRMQLSPHTLFNLLNTIRSHITREPAMAQSMVVQLADLLRQLLNAGDTEFSRLRDEMKFVRLYLELQRRRFVDRLTISIPADEQLPSTWVPSLILQPLVENAVIHGLSGNRNGLSIRVDAMVDNGILVLRVDNTYVTPQRNAHEDSDASHGIGLRNVMERLAVHFQDRATLVAAPLSGQDWRAEIRMPMLGDGPQARNDT